MMLISLPKSFFCLILTFLLVSPLLLCVVGQQTSANWTQLALGSTGAPKSPLYRWGHNCVSGGIHTDHLFLFGGFANNLDVPSRSLYFLRDGQWGLVGKGEVPPWPSPRWGFNMVSLQDGSGFLLFGGLNDFTTHNPTYYDDVWLFDFLSVSWTLLRENNSSDFGPPGGVWYELSAVPYEDGMAYVENVGGSVWYFSAVTKKWLILYSSETSNTPPGGTVCLAGACKQILTLDHYMNAYTFDTSSLQWSLVLPNTTTPIPRTDRYQYLLGTQDSQNVLLFGGSLSPTRGDQLNDLWMLSLSVSGVWSWEEVVQENPPAAREHSCWPLQPIGQRIMYGGYGAEYLDDTWGLSIEDE